MHKTGKRRTAAIVVLAVFAIIMLAPRTTLAATMYNPSRQKATSIKNGSTVTIYKTTTQIANVPPTFELTAKAGSIKDPKTNNASAARAYLFSNPDTKEDQLVIAGVKSGKAKITFKLNGKKRTVNVVVKNYVNAFKTIKVGKTSLKGKYKTERTTLVSAKKVRGKTLTIKPVKGWRIDKIQAAMGGSFKNIKNGSKVPKKARGLLIWMQNTKTKGFIMYEIGLQE